jgi:hypothetical protein
MKQDAENARMAKLYREHVLGEKPDGALDDRFRGIREGHSHHGAQVPALLCDHVQAGGTDVANAVLLRRAPGPEIGGEAGQRFPRSLPQIGRIGIQPALQPTLCRL